MGPLETKEKGNLMNQLQSQNVCKLSGEDLKYVHAVFDPKLSGTGGMDHPTNVREYPKEYRHLPQEFIDSLERIGSLDAKSNLVIQSARNGHQNYRCPIYTREAGICLRNDEDFTRSERPYNVFGIYEDARMRPLRLDLRNQIPTDIRAFVGGIPVLWDREVCTLETMAPEVSDPPHLWRLRTTTDRGELVDNTARMQSITEVFKANLYNSAEAASRAVCKAAEGLEREADYLHNVLGVTDDGSVVMVMATGTLEHLGELAQKAGASHAICIDNGGSCAWLLRPAGKPVAPFIMSHYHRPETLCMLVYELQSDGPVILTSIDEIRGQSEK